MLRYRFFLEQKQLAPSTINVRLAAVRRLAYEAADAGLLSPALGAGIRRVIGAQRVGWGTGLPSIKPVHFSIRAAMKTWTCVVNETEPS